MHRDRDRNINETLNKDLNKIFDQALENNLKNAFDQIHAEEVLKQHTKSALARELYGNESPHRKRTSRASASGMTVFRRVAAMAACLIALIFIGGSWMFLTPTAFISIDINPSLELGINRFNRIVTVEGYNEDGEALADSLDIRFMNYSDALDKILGTESMEGYLSPDALMTLTVAGDSETQYNEIMEHVESCTADHENIQCHSGDMDEMHEAHESGLSFGKYRAYLILKELDPSCTPDDVRDMTMREIYDLIDSYSGNNGTDASTAGGNNAADSNASDGSTDENEHSGNSDSDNSGNRHHYGGESQGSGHHGH